jgi:hypothetical protein
MAQQEILRRYLDILKEEVAPASAQPSNGDSSAPKDPAVIMPPKDGQGSIQAVIKAVKDYQTTKGLVADGVLGPKTLAAILSDSGTMGAEQLKKLKTSDSDASMVKEDDTMSNPTMTAPTMTAPAMTAPMSETIQDTLRRKAALHEGYACGLMAESHHSCTHPEGSHEHLHYMHGYSKGLAECTGVWSPRGTY